VDVWDVGEAATQVLAGGNPLIKAYEFTSTTAYNYYEVADLLNRTLGRPIQYRNPSVGHFFWRKWQEGVPTSFILVMTALYTVAKLGNAAGYGPPVNPAGPGPTTLAQFAEDDRDAWA
jgi:nucleoside-diphosphate-sugar epimerase